MYKYVVLHGSLWRLKPISYDQLMRAIANGRPFEMVEYGEPLGRVDADVSKITTNETKGD